MSPFQKKKKVPLFPVFSAFFFLCGNNTILLSGFKKKKQQPASYKVIKDYESQVGKGWLLRFRNIISLSFHVTIYDGISIFVYIQEKYYTLVQVYTRLISFK